MNNNIPIGYAFEPHIEPGAIANIADDVVNINNNNAIPGVDGRLGTNDWCKCGNCSTETLSKDKECICCCEIDECAGRLVNSCIISNPNFMHYCINYEGLEIGLSHMATARANSMNNLRSRPVNSRFVKDKIPNICSLICNIVCYRIVE